MAVPRLPSRELLGDAPLPADAARLTNASWTEMMADEPIQAEVAERMHEIGKLLADAFHGYGIALLVFDLGDTGKMNYLSNARREDMLAAMREFIARNEGRALPPTGSMNG